MVGGRRHNQQATAINVHNGLGTSPMPETSTIEPEPDALIETAPVPAEDDRPKLDWAALIRNPVFQATAILTVALMFAFSGLMRLLPEAWFGPDTLFSHGP